MNCEGVRKQLTAYLDGELEGDRGSAVRGHLRGCDDCRQVASDEAALRDGLRSLPPVDPPASLWAGVQARLAAAEVADSEKPAWRRALARWTPKAPQLGLAGLAVAALVVLLAIKLRHHEDPPVVSTPTKIAPTVIQPDRGTDPTPAPNVANPADCNESDDGDVTAQVAAEPAHVTACYAQAAQPWRDAVTQERAHWSDERKHEVDGKLASFDKEIATAKSERARQKTYRSMIRYLQRAVIHDDDVALASTGGAP
ncbi:MAG TPA: anti-sigma factor [Kofleriaceae bacterium]|nr:anti-sigma factor [Kofleriaceae bacterium]